MDDGLPSDRFHAEMVLDLPFGRKLIRTISAVLGIIWQIRIRNFVVVEIISKKHFDFLCVRGPITYNVTAHVHVLWLVFTRVLIRCRHTADRHTQTTYSAQTRHTSNPTVVVSLDDS